MAASAGLQVFVRLPEGSSHCLELDADATVGALRAAAAEAAGVASVSLQFSGEPLSSDRVTLADAGVGMEAVVEAAPRVKGRVCLRVRAPHKHDRPPEEGEPASCFELLPGGLVRVHGARDARVPVRDFEFESVFGPESTTRELEAWAAPAADAVLQGGNAAVIAYGISRSGRTTTLFGSGASEGNTVGPDGIAPALIDRIVRACCAHGSELQARMSIIEAGADCCCLLTDVTDGDAFGQQLRTRPRVRLRAEQSGGVPPRYVALEGVHEEVVTSSAQACELIAKARRAQSFVHMHVGIRRRRPLVIRLELRRLQDNGFAGQLLIAEPPGCERIRHDPGNADRLQNLREHCQTNAAFSEVVRQLVMPMKGLKQVHIPWRNSAYTWLLAIHGTAPGRGGIWVAAHLIPSPYYWDETYATLRFIQVCAKIGNDKAE